MKRTNGKSSGKLIWLTRLTFSLLTLVLIAVILVHSYITQQVRWLPGESFSGAPTRNLQQLEDALAAHLQVLARDIGERSLYQPEGMRAAERYITEQLSSFGLDPQTQHYTVEAELIRQTSEQLRRLHGT